ncbi:MAG: hypothetical protein IT524_01375 [Nitrosomonas sp.]|nr:hypothetical protein [Nitrosomonas sp.]
MLIQQTMTDGATRTATQHQVPYSATIKGWYLNLPLSGERITAVPSANDGILFFTTIVPSASPCDFGGRGFLNILDYYSGGMLFFPTFDHTRNRVLSLEDGLSAGIEIGFSIGGGTSITDSAISAVSDNVVGLTGDDRTFQTLMTKGAAGLRGRITWREFMP